MFCPKCGQQNPEDAAFCRSCATPIAPIPAVPQQPVMAAQAPVAAPAPTPVPAAAPPYVPAARTPRTPSASPVAPFLFMSRLIEYVSHGMLFRRIVAGFLIACGALAAIGGVAAGVVGLIGYIQFGGLAIFGGLIAMLFMFVAAYMWAHTYFIRARSVRDIPEGEYTVIPIMSVLLKMTGELAFVSLLSAGVQGTLATWFMGANPMEALRGYGGYGGYGMTAGEGFIVGVIFLLGATILGFVALLVYYLLSELVVILADIARDVRALRGVSHQA